MGRITVEKHEGYYLHIPKWSLLVVLGVIWMVGVGVNISHFAPEIRGLSPELNIFVTITSAIAFVLPYLIWTGIAINNLD